MRFGILSFGSALHPDQTLLADALRARDIDIAAGESAIAAGPDAAREAKRLARADCDGVTFLLTEGAASAAVTEAALHLAGVPILLYAPEAPSTLFAAAGALEEIGAAYDRLLPASGAADPAGRTEEWLRENAKPERHRGQEAARRLYGQRLYVPMEAPGRPDASLWMHQFGVVLAGAEEAVDFGAPDGDAYGALTTRLLEAVSGSDAVVRVPLAARTARGEGEALYSAATAADTSATFARISRRVGRFRCLLLRGELVSDGAVTAAARFACPAVALYAAAASPWLHAAPGDHLGTLRAACLALDIEPVILRDEPENSP